MKIKGQTPGLNRDVLVIERPDGDYVFTAESLPGYDEFNRLCPTPEPPALIKPDGTKVYDTDAEEYKKAMAVWGQRKVDYIVIASLAATDGLEWESVKLDSPGTWHKWSDEMRAAGLNEQELVRIQALCFSVNSLSEQKMEAARQRFFRSQAASKAAQAT